MEDRQLVNIETAGMPEEKRELTPRELQLVEQYRSSIDLSDKSAIIRYGAKAQTQMVSFSESVLSQIRNKDLGEVGDILSGMVADLRSFDKSIKKPGILGFFQSLKKKVRRLKADFTKVEKNVTQVEVQLEKHYQSLLKDIHLFDALFEQNEQYYNDLSLYIYAGEEKVAEMRQAVLPALKQQAEESDDAKIKQQYNYLEQQTYMFEKKIQDLKVSRVISLQLAPQLRLVQNNSAVLMERIQSSIVNTLPLWRNQMVLALGLVHSEQALEAQRAVNEATNKMLKRNSEMLRTTSTRVAEENERNIVDMETLHQVNNDLFATIDSVLAIQQEGRRKRFEIEKELIKTETELRKRMS